MKTKKILALSLVFVLFSSLGVSVSAQERRGAQEGSNNAAHQDAELISATRGQEMRERAQELRERRAELREARKEAAQQGNLEMREEARERLAERTQERAERIAERVNRTNERFTDAYLRRLDRYENILNRIESRIAKVEEAAEVEFVDVSDLVEDAHETLLTSKEMVLAQAEQTYVVEAEMPNELGQAMRTVLAEIRDERHNLRDEAMHPAREAVVAVFQELRAAASETDEEDTEENEDNNEDEE